MIKRIPGETTDEDELVESFKSLIKFVSIIYLVLSLFRLGFSYF